MAALYLFFTKYFRLLFGGICTDECIHSCVADILSLAEAQDQADDEGEEEQQNAPAGGLTERLCHADVQLHAYDEEKNSASQTEQTQ